MLEKHRMVREVRERVSGDDRGGGLVHTKAMRGEIERKQNDEPRLRLHLYKEKDLAHDEGENKVDLQEGHYILPSTEKSFLTHHVNGL